MLDQYKTIYKYGTNEIIVKKSKFIGHARQIESEDDAIKFINQITNKYHDATHNVYAYILGENDEVQRFNDNGEPSGTAGIPILTAIKNEGIKNVVVVVTRYFGGILLGASGLIRSYVKSAKNAIEDGLIVDKVLFQIINVSINYTLLGMVKNSILKNGYKIKNITYTDKVKIEIYVYINDVDNFIEYIKNLTNDNVMINSGRKLYLYKSNNRIFD